METEKRFPSVDFGTLLAHVDRPRDTEQMRTAALEKLNKFRLLNSPEKSAQWLEFLDAFFKRHNLPLSEYAANTDSFAADSYQLVALVSNKDEAYNPRVGYGGRGRKAYEPMSRKHLFLDAPFAYCLLYKTREKENWAVISVISFKPDFARKVLNIDQLQGGDTELRSRIVRARLDRQRKEDTATKTASQIKEERRARMKFKEAPEDVLFNIVKDLSISVGMEELGLRKPSRSLWGKVKEGKIPLYARIAKKYDMRESRRHHFILPLTENSSTK